ncbi:MAG: glycosyltransferase family 2 protein [Actinobacteria bacterium]|nr:glycosyltransferase family 2 protein [Actinomycetota bacterium]
MTPFTDAVFAILPLAMVVLVVGNTLLQGMLYVSASIELRRTRGEDRYRHWRVAVRSLLAPRVSVLMPAYGEEATIVDSVSAVLALSYPNIEVVVVNDGSRDRTLEMLVDHFAMSAVHPVVHQRVPSAEVVGVYRSAREPRLVVVDKRNGGKADALNCGLNTAEGELVCAIDADTLVGHDALQHLVAPFAANPKTVATGGTIRLVNDSVVRGGRIITRRVPRGVLAGVQVIEYLRAFLVGRLGWNPLGGNLLISGAFGLFRRDALIDVGGYEQATVGEDLELVVRLRRLGYERGCPAPVLFSPEPVAWTEAPESLRMLARQRNRWYRGLCDVLVRHRRMIFNPRYRSAGLLAMPYYLLVEALAPIVEALGLFLVVLGVALGSLSSEHLGLIAASYVFGIAATVAVLLFDDLAFRSHPGVKSRLHLLLLVPVEQLLFRPLTVWWRLWGLSHFFQGRTDWGAMVRRGFGDTPVETAAAQTAATVAAGDSAEGAGRPG